MSGWTTKKLGEVCEVVLGGTPRTSIDEYWGGSVPWLTPGDMGKIKGLYVAETSRSLTQQGLENGSKLFPENSVVLSTRAPIGYVLINTVPMCTNQGCKTLIPNSTIAPEYLAYNLIGRTIELNELGTGTTFKELSTGVLKNIDIPIPPLAEQKRIVTKIDAAFEKIDRLKANAEKNLANAKELFQSALDEAMRPKKGWVEKRLGEVANIRVGPFGSSLHKADYVDNGVPLVNPCHMKDSKIADRISTQVSHDKAESLKEYRLKAGDIVFARRGEIGRLAFVSEKEDGYLCGTGSLFARFRERYDIQFLYFFFSSKSFVERLEQLSTGTTMKSINSSALESMSFSVPLMNDQQRLAKQLDSLSQKTKALQQNYARQIADCAEMRQAILREAFEGRL